MIVFQNPGLIDLDAAIIMGINAKLGESPIGFFGTGLKYSIATLLRNKCVVVICRGTDFYHFTTEKLTTRGQDFDVVCMNGQRLGFTTALGRNWQPWQAYRELYSNAKDENGKVYALSEAAMLNPSMLDNETNILVTGEAIEHAHLSRADFILEGAPDFPTVSADIFLRPNASLFYRGMRVSVSPLSWRYTYNINRQIILTEDRTTANMWQIHDALCDAFNNLVEDGHEGMVEGILCEKIFAEKDINFNGIISTQSYTEPFLKLLDRLVKTRALDLNKTAITAYKRLRPEVEEIFTHATVTSIMAQKLDRAVRFATKIGFPVADYPIIIVTRLGDGIMGLAKNGTIYVTAAAFDKGTKELAATVIEEFIHLREGHQDETRSMQNYLFDKIVSLGEEHIWKEPL